MLGAMSLEYHPFSLPEMILVMGVGFVLVAGLVVLVLFLTRPRSEELEDAEEP